MKNSKWLLVILVILVGLSCGKNKIADIEDPVDTEGMLSLIVPDGFDWKMSTSYNFVFSGGSFGVVEISSADGSAVYHRSSYIEGNDGTYTVSLKLPTYMKKVRVNSEMVNLSAGTIDIDMSQKAAPINWQIDFDGISSFVDLGDINALDATTAFTIEGWAIVDDWTPDNTTTFFDKYIDGANGISILLDPSGQLNVFVSNAGTSYGYITRANLTPTINDGDCFHFAVVYNGLGGSENEDKLILYINGAEKTLSWSGTIPTVTADYGANHLVLGDGANDFFDGSFDEFRIWSYARTATEILDNKFMSFIGDETGLVAYYQCNEGTGTTLVDKVGSYTALNITDISWNAACNDETIWLDDDFDGISDGPDVYPDDPLRAFENFYPASSEGTLVFEDLWPGFGDFDFNDLVVGYRFKTVSSATNRVVEIIFTSIIRANGAMLANGFGFELRGADIVNRVFTDLNISGFIHSGSGVNTTRTSTTNSFENGQTYPTVIVIDNINEVMGEWTNTIVGGPAAAPVTITVSMIPTGDYVAAEFGLNDWNPFIFNQFRSNEIHLPNYGLTSLGSNGLFGTFDDDSDGTKMFLSPSNLPWVLEIPGTFEYPIEKATILSAYPKFRNWAEYTGGDPNPYDDWYSNIIDAEYRDSDFIYYTP